MNVLSPSMLAIDFANMGKMLKVAYDAEVSMIHVDVMDGAFVPNISFGPPVINYVRTTLPDVALDIHMMVNEPVRFLDKFVKLKASIFTVHYEAVADLKGTLQQIHEAGMRAGVALKPATPVAVLNDYLDDIDMILIMSVEPGFGGQSFQESAYDKIREAREMVNHSDRNIDIEVDGGIILSNLKDVLDAGANVIVAGTAIFEGDCKENIKRFQEIML